MKKARRVRHEIGDITLKNVERYIRTKGWDILYYGNGGSSDKYLLSLGLLELSETVDSLTCRDRMKTTIFIKDSFTHKQKLFLALHEIGHLVLGHNIGQLSFNEEREADHFADICLKHAIPKSAWIVSIVSVIMCIVFFTVISTHDATPRDTGVSVENKTDTVYVTSEGDKFHRNDCYYVENRSNVVELSRENAVKMGKEPCKVCKP